jgi:hypothetical protein
LSNSLILKPGFPLVHDEQTSAYTNLNGFIQVLSKALTCESCELECIGAAH